MCPFFFRLKTAIHSFFLFSGSGHAWAPLIQWTYVTFPKELFYCTRPWFCDGIQCSYKLGELTTQSVQWSGRCGFQRGRGCTCLPAIKGAEKSWFSYWLASVMLPSVINIAWSSYLLQKVEVDHSPEVTEESFDELSADPSGWPWCYTCPSSFSGL